MSVRTRWNETWTLVHDLSAIHDLNVTQRRILRDFVDFGNQADQKGLRMTVKDIVRHRRWADRVVSEGMVSDEMKRLEGKRMVSEVARDYYALTGYGKRIADRLDKTRLSFLRRF